MSAPTEQQQVDIFADDLQQLQYAELCNALYERELLSLSQQAANNSSLLQRRLAGLSHHIKRAAEHLLNSNAPIKVDIHNGSWQSKQAAKCVADKISSEKTKNWFNQHAKFGLPVPVHVSEMGFEHIELDSIDRIDPKNHELHLNKHGWFYFDGEPVESSTSEHTSTRLLQPTKQSCSAACCGHSWNHKGRAQPRALTLRELLLSTTINWKNFR